MLTVDFRPDMIFAVPDPPDSSASGTTQHAEAIGKLSSSSSPGLEQGPDIGVARESFVRRTARIRTPVQFDSSGSAGNFVRGGGRLALGDSGAMAS